MEVRSHRPSALIARVVSEVLRALPICASAALVDAAAALAQAVEAAALTADIPAQPLAQALAVFASQTGLQLVYVSDVVRNRKSHAASTGLSAQDALARILQGTGLRFEFLTARTVRILAVAPARVTATPGGAEEPYEIIVTANRREENLQDVPITIQAFTGEQLKELSATTFNDLLKHTANVSYSGNGPGTGNIFIRGLGAIGTGNQSQSTSAPFPNVALYLDDQAMQFPARNNDVYAVDLERVEILEGPQGTLFGGGAQAGAIRYITNKPKLAATTGELNVGYGITAGGDPNTILSATLNLPLVRDKVAVRAVTFLERRGGYISNVPGTISFSLPSPSDEKIRLISPVANNASLVGPNTNPVTYQGFRLSGLYQFDDEWSLLIQQNYQDMDAEGYFYAYPFDSNGNALKARQITAFTPAYTRDRYESTAWTLAGRLGELKAIYAGSYMARHIEGQQDYSNYLRSVGSYYSCIGPGAGYFNSMDFSVLADKPLKCYPPVGSWRDVVQNKHQSHEIRLSTNEEHRVRAVVGAYWEKFVINDDMNFNYLGIPQCSAGNLAIALAGGADCLSAVGPLPGTQASNPGLRENMGNAFGHDVQRGYKQYAFFASADFDIVPKVLTLTVGTRGYHYDEFEEGSVWYSETSNKLILDHLNGACTAKGKCGSPINLSKSESGLRSRASLTWHAGPNTMFYYTFSQGFRPGGFNRVLSLPGQVQPDGILAYCGPPSTVSQDPRCQPGGSLFGHSTQYVHPVGYNSDNLINNELGFKGEFLNHRLRVNATAYVMHWADVQSLSLGLFALSAYVNGPTYTAKGLELQLLARVTEGLTLQGASSWNSAKQSNVPCLRSSGVTPSTPYNPTPAGQCITVVAGRPYAVGALNTAAPFSPPLVFNLRARYDWFGRTYNPFVWVGVSHSAAQRNEPGNFPDASALAPPQLLPVLKYAIPSYTTYDAALGVTKDHWTVQVTGSNLSNSAAATNISSSQFIKATVPLRPRVLMAEFTYRF
jgi:outer membrane receptor protein involved in Fe transport